MEIKTKQIIFQPNLVDIYFHEMRRILISIIFPKTSYHHLLSFIRGVKRLIPFFFCSSEVCLQELVLRIEIICIFFSFSIFSKCYVFKSEENNKCYIETPQQTSTSTLTDAPQENQAIDLQNVLSGTVIAFTVYVKWKISRHTRARNYRHKPTVKAFLYRTF